MRPAVEAQRSPEREKLAAAIERVVTATAALDRVHQARAKVGSQYDVGVAAAEEALEAARLREPRRLVDELLGVVGVKHLTVAEAEASLADATREQDRRRKIHSLLDEEEASAVSELKDARHGRDNAVKAVVASDPATAALLSAFVEARQRVAELQRIWLALPSRPDDSSTWCPFDHFPDLGGSQAWVAATAALLTDADAALPIVEIRRIERVIVHPPEPA